MAASELAIAPLLDLIGEQAAEADRTRKISPEVISALRASSVMGLTASENIGGGAASMERCGEELEAVTARCTSTGWMLWNHLGTFHLFVGLLGPERIPFLRQLVTNREWVCFPNGAGTMVQGTQEGDTWRLEGKAAFGTAARYADWAGLAFKADGEKAPRFTLLDLRQEGVEVSDDWRAMSLRASATDTLHYHGAQTPDQNVAPFVRMYREVFRRPERAMVAPRYREDWVSVSNLWLGYMAAGLVQACLDEVTTGIQGRIAMLGVKVAERPTVHVNLGHAQANIKAARDTVRVAAVETDERIAAGIIPDEGDYLRQMGAAMTAVKLCDEALRLITRVMGGNGLREGPDFERRWRDFQAMPLHINSHQDRVSEQIGRHALGLATENLF